MSRQSFKSRIQITKTGKIKRRAMGLGHSRANKSRVQILRRRKKRELNISKKNIKKYL